MENKKEPTLVEQFYNIAMTTESSKFEFIRSLRGKYAAKALKKIFKKALRLFKLIKKNIVKDYKKFIKNNDPVNGLFNLMALSNVNKCISFYSGEIKMLNSELSEFQCFLNSGNRLKCRLGYIRQESELFNYKEAPIMGVEDE